jgi:hypothetical protein
VVLAETLLPHALALLMTAFLAGCALGITCALCITSGAPPAEAQRSAVWHKPSASKSACGRADEAACHPDLVRREWSQVGFLVRVSFQALADKA